MSEKIPTVKIEFHNLPDLVISGEEYDNMGKFKGFLKAFEMSILEIKKVHHLMMSPRSYPRRAWEG